MADRNWAEHDRQIMLNPTLEQARGTGRIHRAYGWSKSPWGNWSDEHKAAYSEGYDDVRTEEGSQDTIRDGAKG